MTTKTIYTISYGGRTPTDFTSLLVETGVELICDVRINPHGGYMGSYRLAKTSEKGIQKLLESVGIDYVWLKELGNPEPHDPLMTHFREVVALELRERTKRLISLAQEKVSCLLCCEKRVAECHRLIIGEYLESQGWSVSNL